jgi:hypothetical protein
VLVSKILYILVNCDDSLPAGRLTVEFWWGLQQSIEVQELFLGTVPPVVGLGHTYWSTDSGQVGVPALLHTL